MGMRTVKMNTLEIIEELKQATIMYYNNRLNNIGLDQDTSMYSSLMEDKQLTLEFLEDLEATIRNWMV